MADFAFFAVAQGNGYVNFRRLSGPQDRHVVGQAIAYLDAELLDKMHTDYPTKVLRAPLPGAEALAVAGVKQTEIDAMVNKHFYTVQYY